MSTKKHNKSTGRRYDDEYRNYQSKPEVMKQRARNNKANRDAGTYANGDGLDVAHSKPKARGKIIGLQSPSTNRSFSRTSSAKRKS